MKTLMVPPNNLGHDLNGKPVNETQYKGMIGSIELTGEGWLLLHTADGKKNITSQTHSTTAASMLDSGNFVLYNHSHVTWESFAYPCDTLLGGQKHSAGDQLVSSVSATKYSSGRFKLYMGSDGNLAAYPQNSSEWNEDAYWSNGTSSSEYDSLNLNRHSGSLYMTGSNASATLRTLYQPTRS
ncbi:S-locus glycoprotein domain-containing protein [Tanacetum coccineum]